MQVVRLMGMPDKVIAFDELPKDMLEGLEMLDCSKMGRAWRDFIGKVERIVKLKPELDPLTRQMRTFPEIKEVAPFAYLVDSEINNDKEIWSKIVDYVKRNAPSEWEQTTLVGKERIRMMDNVEAMAKPLAPDSHSELTLEPEEVIVIPLKKAAVPVDEGGVKVSIVTPSAPAAAPAPATEESHPCPDCGKEFGSKQAVRLHKTKKHPAINV